MTRSDPSHTAEFPVVDTTVKEKTGKGWDQWLEVLDDFGGTEMNHPEMVKRLGANHPQVGAWWLQTIVVGYERARGLRAKHETRTGFNASVSKTIAVPVEQLFRAWSDPRLRSRWLDADLEITTSTESKTIRGSFADGSRLAAGFTSKGEAKCQVALEHSKLPGSESVAEVKAQWKERLGRLTSLLTEKGA